MTFSSEKEKISKIEGKVNMFQLNVTTVKLSYNKHSYYEFTAITS
jgi:hypothetical protein